MDKEQAKEKIKELIAKYQDAVSFGKLKTYSEEETKIGFILPLFAALGWNTENKQEVSAEEHVKSQGRVDFGFYINNIVKFYLEAKPFKADIDKEEYARQAFRYSWHKGITYAVLTDFASLKVFNALADSRNLLDKLIFELPCSEFLTDFETLWLLSKESFENNLLDKWAEKHGKKKKKLTVDEKLYDDLKEARRILTDSFPRWNKKLDQETLEEGVQRILDRLVFIRVLEDRGLEQPILKNLVNEAKSAGDLNRQIFPLLIKKFRELDDIYNSNIFRKHPCEKWEEYDGAMARVISLLYGGGMYEYDFKIIPADILGGVYESYLSYMAQNPIEIDKGREQGRLFKVESKKELKQRTRQKRKEQGIYYTPKFVVDYIVKNTLGEKLKEVKSIHELNNIKILDPACGSGSFLTKALEVMNDKYKDFAAPGNQITKTRILLGNIYGVDLDPKAVELAKLNLLIDALDKKDKLPDLTGNVRVGNSLISGSDKELKKYFGDAWREKKPFNWQEEFADVLKQGGFDVVIGNPPWGANIDKDVKYLEDKYPNSTKSHKDIYKIFIDKSLSLLRPGGMLGFIVPNTFTYQPRYEDIKEVINQYENYVINLGERIFSNVQLPCCILIVVKRLGGNKFTADLTKEKRENLANKIWQISESGAIKQAKIANAIIKNTGLTFDEVFLMKDAGINYQAVKVGKGEKGKSKLGELLFYEGKKENKSGIEYWKGSHIGRYFIQDETDHFVRTNFKDFKQENERVILNEGFFKLAPKIIWRQTASSIIAAVDLRGVWFGRSIIGAIPQEEYKNKVDIFYALAIFNSKYIDYLYRQKVLETGKVFPQVKLKYLRDLPFVIGSKSQQKKISELAKKMLELNKGLRAVPENSDKWRRIKEEIERTDKEIDEKIYELYGLSEEERRAVKGK